MRRASFLLFSMLTSILFACGVDYNPEKSKAERDTEREWRRQKMLHQRNSEVPEAPEIPEEIINGKIEDLPEMEAEFPGGQAAMMRYLQANIVYPEKDLDQGVGGRVYVRFVVTADGSIRNVKVVRGVSPTIDAESIRVIRKMPKWKPARSSGKPVNMWYNLPIKYTPA